LRCVRLIQGNVERPEIVLLRLLIYRVWEETQETPIRTERATKAVMRNSKNLKLKRCDEAWENYGKRRCKNGTNLNEFVCFMLNELYEYISPARTGESIMIENVVHIVHLQCI
jgi:hypothetical protein